MNIDEYILYLAALQLLRTVLSTSPFISGGLCDRDRQIDINSKIDRERDAVDTR